MPIRTITLPNGKKCTRKITNLHPDGTEFDPSDIVIGETPGTEEAAKIMGRMLRDMMEIKNAEEQKQPVNLKGKDYGRKIS